MTTETYSELGTKRPHIPKDPDAILDYSFDWTSWLALVSDAISTYAVTVDGVTKVSDSRAAGIVTVWVSGGTAGAGVYATVTCAIVTTGGRTEQRTIYLRIVER